MHSAQPAHHDTGLHRILNRAGAYAALQKLLLRGGSRERYVREFVKPFSGCRILDIGCGPADILVHLPETIGEYLGFDMNPDYIEAAQRRWGGRGTFRCQKVEAATLAATDACDIVLANGILHHLGDEEARQLFDIAHRALRPGGWLVTYDNVYIENQHWFARWLIRRDRGQAVRTREGYEALARGRFSRIESTILHDTLRVPYTILIMRCSK
ncbi:MAG: class I SAM-dependent methyltransferase [Betaproteobacteria bacterium]|nr:class I SAM-dependent methyltransferase [Betaproteobacteria bacterium]